MDLGYATTTAQACVLTVLLARDLAPEAATQAVRVSPGLGPSASSAAGEQQAPGSQGEACRRPNPAAATTGRAGSPFSFAAGGAAYLAVGGRNIA